MGDEPTSWRAKRGAAGGGAGGGELHLEQDRVVFEPHALDRALAAQTWELPRARLTHVEVAGREPRSHLFGAGLRRQLRLLGADGQEARFVVNDVEDVAEAIRRWANPA